MDETKTHRRQELQALKARVAALDHEVRQLRSMLDQNPAVTYRAKPSGDYCATYVSGGITVQLGYQPRDFTADPAFWADHLHPEDQTRVLAEMAQAAKNGSGSLEYRFQHQDGAYRWMRDELALISGTATEPAELVGYWTDITERRDAEDTVRRARDELETEVERRTVALSASEAKFRLLAEHGPFMVSVYDGTGFVYVNRVFEEVSGYTRAELRELKAEDLAVPEDRRLLRKQLPMLIRQGVAFNYEWRLRTKDGVPRWLFGCVATIQWEETRALLTAAVDITERKQAEAEALALRDQLAHVTRVQTLGELTASLAHEVNQPLTALATNAEVGRRLLDQAPLDRAGLAATLDDIAADAVRAGEIVYRLRGLVQKQAVEARPVDANDLVQQVVPLVANDLRLKSIALRFDLAADLQPVVGDPVQLQQVLLNLLTNAIEAIDAGGDESTGTIVVRTALVDGAVEVAVEDTGVGLDPARAATVFDPFVTTKPEGLGMGLSISRSIVEAHGGRLWGTPHPERGTTFAFSMPIGPGGSTDVPSDGSRR